MRICLVSSSFYPAIFYGGPISATWDLSKKLAENNIKIYVSATNANGLDQLDVKVNQFIKKQENFQVKYYHEQIINKFSVAFLLGIWSDIKKADVVYIQYLFHYTVPLALFVAWFQNKKIVLCPRGSFSNFTFSNRFSILKKMWFTFLIKPFIRKIKWQASSYLEANDIKKAMPKANVKEVNDGVDFSLFQNANELSYNALIKKYTNKNFQDILEVFFSMGRLHKIKRFDVLIDAFSLFVKDNPNAKLLIAGGDDGVASALEKQVSDLGLKESVFLIGSVNHEQKRELFGNCTAFALASEFESFGIVVAEALSCGCPVIVSNKTPWKDIEENKCGIFTQNDKMSFYYSLKQLKEEKLKKEDCKRYVKTNFDWEVVSRDFVNSFLTES